MLDAKKFADALGKENILRKHSRRALAYVEAKMIVREMVFHDQHALTIPFKPVHYYMHLLPGINVHFVPAKFIGWRRLRAIDAYTAGEEDGFVRFQFNVDYLRLKTSSW